MNFENGLFCDQSNRLLYKINKFKTLLNELDSRSIKSEPIKHDAPIMIPLKYKSNIFLPVTFVLLGLTLLPMQYHLNNFNLQILKMNDSCSDPTALIFNSLSENQTVLFNTLFPYGISNVLRLENFLNELKLLDDLNRKQSLNNITIKYLSQSECLAKNYTKYLNMISVGSEQVNHDKFNSLVKKHLFYQIPYSNIILICDDELYRKSLINMGRMVQPNLDYDIYNDAFAYEIPDYQSNVLVQWNITCANLESSSVTVAYAQMSFLSGKIIGAIFLSILADYVGRKNIYLTTLYASGVVGSLISIVQNYKHFLAIRFLIAALVQGCYIACYVLLFEIIINLKHRNIYCVLFVSLEPFLNTFIGLMTKYVNDWRYLQLVGSLFVSVAFIYPWTIKESFRWLIIRENFKKAENTCKKIFSNVQNPQHQISQIKQLDSSIMNKSAKDISIFQPTLRRIITFFLILWSFISFINYFINDENFNFITDDQITSDICLNFIVGIFNLILILVVFNLGKRIPLSVCLFIGSSFYLGSSLLNTHDSASNIVKLILNIFSKVFFSCSLNVLILFVCELFPCEIRCSSFSFFLSIKHLTEMLSIYLLKINGVSLTVPKVCLCLICVLICILPLLLPEQTILTFNLAEQEQQNEVGTNNTTLQKRSRFSTLDSNKFILNINEMKPPQDIIVEQESNYVIEQSNGSPTNEEIDTENVLAKDIIEKMNLENRSKSGKINPLFEEEQIYSRMKKISSGDTIYDLNKRPSHSKEEFNENLARKLFLIKQGSTKF